MVDDARIPCGRAEASSGRVSWIGALAVCVAALLLSPTAVIAQKVEKTQKSSVTAKKSAASTSPTTTANTSDRTTAKTAAQSSSRSSKAAVSASRATSGATPAAKNRPQASARSSSKATPRAAAGSGLKASSSRNARRVAALEPRRTSVGEAIGLHAIEDDLNLKSSVALVIDQETNEVLFSKNPSAVLPIASITKLMTALVVMEADLPMDQLLTVGVEDVQATSGSRSRLALGTELSRAEMMHLALMASENRAANLLGRTYPGGMSAFISAMNAKAQLLGMSATRYVEPTGLSSDNRSSAVDLTRLVKAAFSHPTIRELSTSLEMEVPVGQKAVQFRNTNGLVRNPEWEIGLQKTGYIAAAGRCLVLQAQMAGRQLIMVLLDSTGKYSRMGDAERLRSFLASAEALAHLPAAALRASSSQPR